MDIHGLTAGANEAQRRRRILILTPRNPYPVIGGDRLRIHRLARELARHHELTLLTFCQSRSERDAPLPDDGVFSSVHRVWLPPWRSWLNALAALPTAEPLQVAYYRSSRFRSAVEALAPAHDVVIAHLVRTAEYARSLPGLRVLEMSDAISMTMARAADQARGYFDFRRYLYGMEARRVGAYERRIASEFNMVTLTSPVDRAFLFGAEESASSEVLIVGNGVDAVDEAPPLQGLRPRNEIAFVGNLHSASNFDAAWYFAHEVMPLILERRPDVLFRVIGPLSRSAARKLGAHRGTRVEGLVPSVPASLLSARVGICPVRFGAGVQNKVLDYFASRLAVVCSPTGVEGLDAEHDEHVLVANDAAEWASSVLSLLENEPLAQRLADAGYHLAKHGYRWEHRTSHLHSRLESLLSGADESVFLRRPALDADSVVRTSR